MSEKNKHLEEFRAKNLIDESEKYIGAFVGRVMPFPLWFLVMGPFYILKMKNFQVVVTDKRI